MARQCGIIAKHLFTGDAAAARFCIWDATLHIKRKKGNHRVRCPPQTSDNRPGRCGEKGRTGGVELVLVVHRPEQVRTEPQRVDMSFGRSWLGAQELSLLGFEFPGREYSLIPQLRQLFERSSHGEYFVGCAGFVSRVGCGASSDG